MLYWRMSKRTPIDIRPAVEADLAGIAAVLVATWRSTFAGLLPEAFLQALSEEEQLRRHRSRMRVPSVRHFVAVERGSGTIVGFANSGPSRVSRLPYAAELYALYVLKSHQGQGIGQRLVQAVAAEAVGQGQGSMLVWVLADNLNRRFYARLGAVPVARGPIALGGVSVGQIAYAWDDLVEQFGLQQA